MRRQNRLDFRDLLAGDGARARVADGIAAIAGGAVASGEANAHYGPGVFCDLAVLAAASSGPVHAFSRDSAAKRGHAGGSPTDEWSRLAARSAVASDPALALTAAAAGQLRELRKAGSLPKESAFAIDKTLIRRWDRRPGDALVRGRTEKGKQPYEAHKAAQSANRRVGTAVAAVRVLPGHAIGGQLSIIGSRALGACAAAGIRPTLLMDRESCATGCVGALNALGARWLMPCPNTPRVIEALREFAEGRRARVSTMHITDGHGREEPYTMIIVKRRKKRKGRTGAPPRPPPLPLALCPLPGGVRRPALCRRSNVPGDPACALSCRHRGRLAGGLPRLCRARGPPEARAQPPGPAGVRGDGPPGVPPPRGGRARASPRAAGRRAPRRRLPRVRVVCRVRPRRRRHARGGRPARGGPRGGAGRACRVPARPRRAPPRPPRRGAGRAGAGRRRRRPSVGARRPAGRLEAQSRLAMLASLPLLAEAAFGAWPRRRRARRR